MLTPRHTDLLFVFIGFIVLYAVIGLINRKWLLKEYGQISGARLQSILNLAFPSNLQEIPKMGVLRCAFGVVLLIRLSYQWTYLLPAHLESTFYMAGLILMTLLSLFIMLGFLTTLSLLASIILMFGERIFHVGTLGNDIATILSILLIFSGSHHSLSLDRILQKKWSGWFGLSGNKIFSTGIRKMPDQMARFKFASILSYWCMCLYSGFKHYTEPSWMSGDAATWLLTSSYLIEQFEFFRSILAIPLIEDFFRLSLWTMFPWYLIFLPAFFIGGWVQRFNLVWWFLFLLLSSQVLQLGALGEFELVYFALIALAPPKRSVNRTIEFYYDGKCNLCARTMSTIRALDITRRVRMLTAQNSKDYLKKNKIPMTVALTQLVGEYQGKFYKGYDLYFLLIKKLPLLWIFVPVFAIGKWTGLGYRIYKKIADNRIKLFGSCALPGPKKTLFADFKSSFKCSFSNRILVDASYASIIFLAFLFLVFPPIGVTHQGAMFKPFKDTYRAANILGIAQINVFNKTDLQMSSHWRVMEFCGNYKNAPRTNCTQVPLTGNKGERLEYHKSDTLYYNGTLKWRRKQTENAEVCDYGEDHFLKTTYLNHVAAFYMAQNDHAAGLFKITYHYLPLPDLNQDGWSTHWDQDSKVCDRFFYINDAGDVTDLN